MGGFTLHKTSSGGHSGKFGKEELKETESGCGNPQ